MKVLTNVVLALAGAILIVSCAIPYWVQKNGQHIGLWQTCNGSKCRNVWRGQNKKRRQYLLGCRILCVTSIALILICLAVLPLWKHFGPVGYVDVSVCIILLAIVSSSAAAILFNVGLQTHLSGPTKGSLSWAYFGQCTGTALLVMAFLLSALSLNHMGKSSSRGRSMMPKLRNNYKPDTGYRR